MSECCRCGMRDATWPEPADFGGFRNVQIYCRLCTNIVIAEVALDAHIDRCETCHYKNYERVMSCDEGKALYVAYWKAVDTSDDVE